MSEKPTLHLLGIPHTITRPDFSHCAFTNKVRTFAPMMRREGYRVIHYGNGDAQSGADENVEIFSEARYNEFMGGAPDLRSSAFDITGYANSGTGLYRAFNAELARELKQRVAPEDIVCCTFGTGHRQALDQLGVWAVETGIGYPHSYLPRRIFESYAWMHNTIGREGSQDGDDYFWVIPNYYNVTEWDVCHANWSKEYVLFIGRISSNKGMDVYREMAKARPDLQFLVVGQGDPTPWLLKDIPNLEHLPPVLGVARAELYGRAIATVCMTRFLEPFCQVHIESQLCGTPVITSNFGVFGETVVDGVNGFKCNTLGDTLAALEGVDGLDRTQIQKSARLRYGTRTVGKQYDAVFQQISDLRGRGWYTLRSRHGPITKAKAPVPEDSAWQEAQKWERAWWTPDKYAGEVHKQGLYAALMGMDGLDFSGKAVLDLGCGPVGLVQRAKFESAVAVDPNDYDDVEEYARLGIERVISSAEDYNGHPADEVWMYNVLQHTENPEKVLESAKRNCAPNGTIRLFEWLNLPPHTGHLHELTLELFDSQFAGWRRVLWTTGTFRDQVFTGDYLAAVLRREG